MIPLTGLAEMGLNGLRGVGPKIREKLMGMGIHSLQDVLFHLPYRYEDQTRLWPMETLGLNDHALVEGTIERTETTRGPRPRLICYLADRTGMLKIQFFHFYPQQVKRLSEGRRMRCFGQVSWHQGQLQMVHPEYHLLGGEEVLPLTDRLTAVYPSVQGISQKAWRQMVDQVLNIIALDPERLPELLPESFTQGAISLREALEQIHRPLPDVSLDAIRSGAHPAVKRLAFEELLAHHLSLRLARAEYHQAGRAPGLHQLDRSTERFLERLPFALTSGQTKVWEAIRADLQQERAMLRLVQGDVGAGKTVVAALAMVAVVSEGYQAALMAPTELLVEQHWQTMTAWLEPLGFRVSLLTGSQRGKRREEVLAEIQSGEAQVIVGTHALFQPDVHYANLALVVIDEQHRFGVQQRMALKHKGAHGEGSPHQLIMTATPIPRTLAMIGYADLDSSVIDTLPPGRQPIVTVAISNQRRDEMMDRVRTVCMSGRQVYWVCTLIEESEQLESQAAEELVHSLRSVLVGVTIGLVHGRLKSAEKEEIMQRFKAGEIQLLVATTVIEVGVDVPNATLMIIENAERLGLAQLHQIRGRVGRGQEASQCVLLYQPPLSALARQRLDTLRKSNDGFEISRKDLQLRGPGEVLGTRQTGEIIFRVADLGRDEALLEAIPQTAKRLMQSHPAAAGRLVKRWIGANQQFAGV